MSQDNWLGNLSRANNKADEINAALIERNRLITSGGNSTKISSEIRGGLADLNRSIGILEAELNDASNKYHITEKEATRREGLVANLRGRHQHYTAELSKVMSAGGYNANRSSLFGNDGGNGRRPREEDERTRAFDNNALYSQQEQIIRQQDEGLEALRKSIARQKQVGLTIGEELDDQNEMLDDLNEGVDNTNRRLTRETQHVVRVTEKAKAGGMFCCIVLLILAIIVVAAVPFH